MFPKPFSPSSIRWKIKTRCTAVLRALGFGLAVVLFRWLTRPLGKSFSEPTKVAIYSNRTLAILRALIHIIPLGVALAEIILNWKEHYLGNNINNVTYLQYAAKAHEVCIQASIATILFTYIRFEMALGHGLPFGALFSGLQLNQVSTLWSSEFWASAFAHHLPIQQRLSLLTITFVYIMLVAVAGPSSAVLLIPRLDYWPAGRVNIWINATRDDVWPIRLIGASVPQSYSSLPEFSLSNSCPASEWQTIQQHLSLATNGIPQNYEEELQQVPLPSGVQLTGQGSVKTLTILGRGAVPVGYDNQAFQATTPQSVISDALRATEALFEVAIGNINNLQPDLSGAQGRDHVHTISKMYHQPYTSVSCGRDVIRGPLDQSPVYFPIPAGSLDPESIANATINSTAFTQEWAGSDNPYLSGIEYSGITRSDLIRDPGNASDYRLLWFELPQEPFNGSTIGAVTLLPRSSTNSTQEVLLCNLSAGWGSSVPNQSSTSASGSDVTSAINLPQHPNFGSGTSIGQNSEYIFDSPVFPQRLITVSADWAGYLNPAVASLNTTVFDALMTTQLGPGSSSGHSVLAARIILSGLLANGLARTSFSGQIQGTPKISFDPQTNSTFIDGRYWLSGKGDVFTIPANDSDSWLELEVDTTVQGYSYSTRGTAPKMAIAFLLLYCILAALHFVYASISGVSSTSWDSVAEVTALAANSTPTIKLRNTCAGITEQDIFKLPVRVLVTRDDQGDGEHLEMVFGEIDEEEATKRRIKPGRVYGTLPKMAEYSTGGLAGSVSTLS